MGQAASTEEKEEHGTPRAEILRFHFYYVAFVLHSLVTSVVPLFAERKALYCNMVALTPAPSLQEKKLRHRMEVVREIAATEHSYVDCLRLCMDVFMIPLEKVRKLALSFFWAWFQPGQAWLTY